MLANGTHRGSLLVRFEAPTATFADSRVNQKWKNRPYMLQLAETHNKDSRTIFIDYKDLEKTDELVAKALLEQYYR